MREISGHKEQVQQYKEVETKKTDLEVLLDLANEEEDSETFKEVENDLNELKQTLDELEFQIC